MKQALLNGRAMCMLLLLTMPLSSWALTIDGYDIPQTIPATSNTAELKLNGASMRILYGVIDTYIGQLYLETPSTDPEKIIEADEFKRMVYKIVLKRVSGRRIASAMYDALQLNVTKEEGMQLEERLQLLVNMFDSSLKKGEESYLEWVPKKGSRIVINGVVKGMIPGKDLYDAILKIWIGENPVASKFKRQVLGLQDHESTSFRHRKGPR